MDIGNLLQVKSGDLTPAQQQALRYVASHLEEAVFLTASGLARRAGVSEATVVRLAQALGFDGYPAMRRWLREELRDRLSTVERMEHAVAVGGEEGDVLLRVLRQDIQNISGTLRDTSMVSFRRAVEDIRAFGRISVVGLRGAHAPAVILATYLRFLGKEVQLLRPGYGEIWDVVQELGTRDLVVGISFPRYTRLTVEVVQQARSQGARVGAITDSPFSPLASHAHWVLTARCDMDSFIESFTAAVSLINALVTAAGIGERERVLEALRERETVWEQKGVYLSREARRRPPR